MDDGTEDPGGVRARLEQARAVFDAFRRGLAGDRDGIEAFCALLDPGALLHFPQGLSRTQPLYQGTDGARAVFQSVFDRCPAGLELVPQAILPADGLPWVTVVFGDRGQLPDGNWYVGGMAITFEVLHGRVTRSWEYPGGSHYVLADPSRARPEAGATVAGPEPPALLPPWTLQAEAVRDAAPSPGVAGAGVRAFRALQAALGGHPGGADQLAAVLAADGAMLLPGKRSKTLGRYEGPDGARALVANVLGRVPGGLRMEPVAWYQAGRLTLVQFRDVASRPDGSVYANSVSFGFLLDDNGQVTRSWEWLGGPHYFPGAPEDIR